MSKRIALPGLTVITPTQGRATLARSLDSVIDAGGLGPKDEHLVIIDGHGMALGEAERIEALVTSYGAAWRAILHDAGGHTWGHAEVNVALDAARPGNYIVFNDDDDILAPGALEAVRAAARADAENGGPRPHIFRFVPPWRSPIIPEGRLVHRGRISGQCLVTPNVAGKVGRFGHAYDGDFNFIEQTLALWGGEAAAEFHEHIIVIARPDQ